MATIGSLFGGHAPFKQMQAHMRVVHECADQVTPLVAALVADDKEGLKTSAKRIFELESQADALKNEMRLNLPRSLFLPVDRRDLLDVLHTQDSIADTAEDIAGMFLARDMTVPDEMKETLVQLTDRCVHVVGLAGQIIEHLDELLEVGFRGRTAETVEALAEQLNTAEDETDKLERHLARQLFEIESTLDPVTVIFWYQIIEWIGDLADHAEKVGNNIRLIIAR
jgi:predicted phosphate transport protein (TIGR00153 family)